MTFDRWKPRRGAVAVASLAVAAAALPGAAAASAATAPTAGGAATVTGAAAHGPTMKLIAAQNTITVQRFRKEVFLDPGIWLAALKSPLIFDAGRASYRQPLTITQVIHVPGGGTVRRPWPASVLDGWNGLAKFIRLTVRNSAGTVVATQHLTLCPDTYDAERVSPGGPASSPYPQQCAFNVFQKGNVWAIQKGWAVDPAEFISPLRLPLGTYHVTETISPRYVRLLDIPAAGAVAHVTVKVVKGSGCCVGAPARRHHASAPLPPAPVVPTLVNPPRADRPDLVALPSWLINVQHTRSGQDLLQFAATVWIGGKSPLDVEGFRSNGSPVMKAYQYFSRNGHVIGRARAGTMGFDSRKGHNHWHFQQFARYSLLNRAKKVTLLSHKQGFCIAPTDGIDLLLAHAIWRPSFTGFGGRCGSPGALWVREMLPVGWGDTYFQSVAGQSFDITHLRNGTYYIEVAANPQKLLYETTTRNDVSLRKVVLGGQPGHRTVKVPAWNGIDPES